MLPQILSRPSGTPLNVAMMCRALADEGYKVHVLTIGSRQPSLVEGCALHHAPRLPFVDEVPVGFSLQKIAYNIIIALMLIGLLVRHRPKVVHAVEEAAFYAIPLARLFGATAIMDLDSDLQAQLRDSGSTVGRALAHPAGRWRNIAMGGAHTVIAVNRHLQDLATRIRPHVPVHLVTDIAIAEVMRLAVPSDVEALRRRYGLVQCRTIVYTGNLDRRQGVVELTSAMAQVVDLYPDAALLIVGGSEEACAWMGEHARRQGVEHVVRFAGQQPPSSMPEFMALADVLVSPRLEPYVTPLKIFSYMASGRPIVATDLPTHREVLDDRTAILVEPTADGLKRGIVTAFDDLQAAIALGEAAARRLNERHSYGAFREGLRRAYDDAMRHAAPQFAG